MISLRSLAGLCLTAMLLTAAGISGVRAQASDPHEIYERRCGGCHTPHAGDFAQESLRQEEGRIVGRKSGRDLRGFLEAGHGKLKPAEIDILVEQLGLILERGALFQRKCRVCHERSVRLARLELIVRDGVLAGRYSGRNIADFLKNHGRLTEEEVPLIVDALTRHLAAEAR